MGMESCIYDSFALPYIPLIICHEEYSFFFIYLARKFDVIGGRYTSMSGIFNAFYVLFVLEGSLTTVMTFLVCSQVEEDSRELFSFIWLRAYIFKSCG